MAESMFNNLYDIETIQNQNADTSAMNVAKLEPGRATVYGAGVAGNMLSKGFNQALGRQTAQEQKAAAINDIMKRNANLDPADPKSQLVFKKEFLEYNMPDIAMAFDNKYQTMIAAIPARTKTKAADGFYRWDDTGEKVFTDAKLPEETDPDKLAFSLWRKTDAYLLAKDKGQAITDWQESRKSKTGNGDDYASKITNIMASVNGDTTIGGDLYDPQFPDGRNFTRLEAETKFEENKRKTNDQELDVIKRTANFEYANEMVDSTYEAANTAYKDIESMENILQSFEQGAKTGKLEQSLNTMKGVLRTLGADIDVNELMSQEILLAEFEKLALGRMQFLSGSASDNDIKFVKGGGPSFDKTPEANMLLIQQAMELSKEAQNKALFVRGYVSNYTKNNKGKSPAQWELTSAVEAFKNRGDYSDSAQSKYGDIWKSANFVAAGGSREQLINNYGLNQLNTWERYDKVVAGDITTGMATEQYISNKAKARALFEGED